MATIDINESSRTQLYLEKQVDNLQDDFFCSKILVQNQNHLNHYQRAGC